MRFAPIFIVLLLLACTMLAPEGVTACACCAEEGTRYDDTRRMEEFEASILENIKLAPRAELYMTEAGEDVNGKGIAADMSYPWVYTISLLPKDKQWELTFKNRRGQTGKLTLMLSDNLNVYKVDMRERKRSAASAMLYKEWRLKGEVKGTGIFQRGLAPGGTFRLVLQGRGNSCDDASDFNHWVLQVTGPEADYSFYGNVK